MNGKKIIGFGLLAMGGYLFIKKGAGIIPFSNTYEHGGKEWKYKNVQYDENGIPYNVEGNNSKPGGETVPGSSSGSGSGSGSSSSDDGDTSEIVIQPGTQTVIDFGYKGADADATGLPTNLNGWLYWLVYDLPKARAAIMAALWGPVPVESREAIKVFYHSYNLLRQVQPVQLLTNFGYKGSDADATGLPTYKAGFDTWKNRNPIAKELLIILLLEGGVPELTAQQWDLLNASWPLTEAGTDLSWLA